MNKKIENIVHFHLGEILTTNSHKTFKTGIYSLKNSPNFFIKCKTAERLSSFSPFYNQFIYGNPLPSTIDKIGLSKKNFHSDDLLTEIDWFLVSAKKYKTELNIFLNYKKDFETFFLLGQYKLALESVEKVENTLGYSIWSISSKILIYEYTGAQDKAKMLQTEILQNNFNATFTTSLINYISQRCERKLSSKRYNLDVRVAVSNIKSKLYNANRDYYNFQLNFFEHLKYDNLKDVILFDYHNSLIDRYLTIRRTIIYCFSNGIELDEIGTRVKYLKKIVKDEIFNTINLFIKGSEDNENFYDKDYLKIIDLYYAGIYDETVYAIKNMVANAEIDLHIINIYAKSLVLSNRVFSPLLESSCLLNEIAEDIFRIYKRTSNPAESLTHLQQISKNIDFFDVNYQLNDYIRNEQNSVYNRNYSRISVKKANPIIADIFKDDAVNAKVILNKILLNTTNSLSINYKINLLDGNYDSISGISKNKINIDKAIFLFNKQNYVASLSLWREVFKYSEDIPPIIEISIDYIFKILYLTGQYDLCIQWYVDSFMRNPYYVYKILTKDIHVLLKKSRFKNIEITIYFPIFISLISNDENEKGFAIELFCKNLDCFLPSELFIKLERTPYTELFFSYCCNNETLKYYKHLNTTRKRLDERINICNYLTINFELRREDYEQELNLLTNELIIHEGTQKLDDSKIYANDQAILNNELDEFEGLYNRYITIAGLYLKNIKILTINKNELRFLDKKGEMEYSQNEVSYSSDADIDAFYSLFSALREKFLFSKFGIVTYLSTRIRHGVLLGELRPELEKHNLIFFKNKLKDKYEPNAFWVNNSKLSTDERSRLVSIIIDFSSKIDELINAIIKENIQIKLNGEHELGWFDYEFSDKEIYDFALTLFYEENYKAFCKKSLDILWSRTDANLDKIRKILQDDVKTRFVVLINKFDEDIHQLLEKNNAIPSIYTALNTCSTNLQNKIDKIALWFKRSGKTHSDFQLQMLIDIICKNVQRAHPLKIVQINIKNDFISIIKGEFYEHFNDFIRIFVENIFKHTSGNNIHCTIETKVKNKFILITLENDSINADSELPMMDSVTVSGLKLITEGKSGIMKARKIIKDDLRNEQNEIYLNLDNNKFSVTTHIIYEHLLA